MTGVSTQRPVTLKEAANLGRRLVRMARNYRGRVTRSLLLGILVGGLGLIPPVLLKMLVDRSYPSRDLSLMHVIIAAMVMVSLTTALTDGIRKYYTQTLTARLSASIGVTFFNHVQHLPVSFFAKRQVGEITSRIGELRGALASLANVLVTLLVSGTYLILVPPVLILIDWRLAVVALASLPLTSAVTVATGPKMRRLWRSSAEAAAEQHAFQVETLSHIRTIKEVAAEGRIYARAFKLTEGALHSQLRASAGVALVALVNSVTRAMLTGVLSWIAWTRILNDEISLGSYLAFSAYLGYLIGPITQMTGMFGSLQQLAVTLSRAFEYLDTSPETPPAEALRPGPFVTRRIHGTVELSRVSFGYDTVSPVLKDVTLTIPAGSSCAIVGASGAGKSSLLRLVVRFVDPQAGEVRIDGVALPTMALHDIRRQVAIVAQDGALLRGTIWDNLTLGVRGADRRTVENVIGVCRLEPMMSMLPRGFDTEVGEWGATLSGGERQRLMLARALVRNTPVLIMDEATSQLDAQAEEGIFQDILHHGGERTVIFVSHRIAAGARADKVALLEEGRLTSVGTHEALLVTSDSYRRLQLDRRTSTTRAMAAV